ARWRRTSRARPAASRLPPEACRDPSSRATVWRPWRSRLGRPSRCSSPGRSANRDTRRMIDFSFPPEVDEVRLKVREFMETRVRPEWEATDQDQRSEVVKTIVRLRQEAREEWGLWLPHMPPEWGGMGLGPTAMAAVSAEAAKVPIGPSVLNAQAPDEGNQHTLLHWGTDEQKEKYLRPLCEGTARSCFAMTEPEVAGSDPTLIQTFAYQDGDEWVINGHKWFIS